MRGNCAFKQESMISSFYFAERRGIGVQRKKNYYV
nr:MAG TPA: hypothetical protein [Caudoviricetes sp.]DAP03517.1 MAG TPA: hypothetical protein [Caudoviricetes sp.]